MKWMIFFGLILLFSCNAGTVKYEEKDSVTASKPAPPILDQHSVIAPKRELYPGSDTLREELTLKDKSLHVEMSFTITKGDSLFAELTSNDDRANIRVTQIEFPDNTFDGPFGRVVKYKITQNGRYKLIMGPNMMAGDPWTGDFGVKVWVK